ncbi:MAG: GNAT family N-acetyltransferase [Gemmatimonadota bacterium]|nr:GNAT family N-acetyltransferase [Gemmatimonadota bacterium]
MARTMTLVRLSPDQWRDFALSHPDSTTFHHPEWQELLRSHYGFRWMAPALVERGDIVAAAPFLETRTFSGRRKLTCLPFSDCVTPLARGPDHLAEYWRALQQEPLNRYPSVVVRTGGPAPPVPSGTDWVRHLVDLRRAEEPLVLPSSVRRNLRKAERAGLTYARRADPGAIEEFYRLHVLTRRKLGVPVQTRGYFRALHERIIASGLGFVGAVSRGSEVIGAGVFLQFGSTLIYKYGASHPAALSDRPNELLFARTLGIAQDEGYARFDFGVTRRTNEGLRRFKEKWGGVESPVFHAYIRGHPPDGSRPGVAHRVAATAIRRSPTFVCRALGAALYRYAP